MENKDSVRVEKYLSYVGQVFGRLQVTGVCPLSKWKIYRRRNTTYYYPVMHVRCECGNTKDVLLTSLQSGNTQSCGCLNKERALAANTTHGMSKAPEYKVWENIKLRCNPSTAKSDNYGKRGITLSDEWKSFERFYKDMGPRPSNLHSVERLNNNEGYSKENCVWATRRQQQNNRRNTLFTVLNGETVPLAEAARTLGVTYSSLAAKARAGKIPLIRAGE